MNSLYSDCTLCPRGCHANRTENKFGVCGVGDKPIVALADLHLWEEPCISGKNGSGAVFFSGCNLGCVYCQNKDISRNICGEQKDENELCDIYFELKEKGANNINLVTATHFLPHIIKSIKLAKSKGFDLPFIYNTSGYETREAVNALSEVIDVFLPDYKYKQEKDALKYSKAADYPIVAFDAIKTMVENKGQCVFENGLINNGVIIRHLLLPGKVIASKTAMKKLFDEFGNDVYYSIMSQFTPTDALCNFPEINRKVTQNEYYSLIDYCVGLGMKNAFVQDLDSAKEEYIPSFDKK